ncbi:AI-2E family transporter [Roseibium suaedae]|uniref:Predicted PurR-regulated permease PerM n=1 Tax=Roseibium suaedae TaxID=735517 RepID=A0A1M7CZQ9_9HYPH|nr:AI-2E family transporter [Roseibium suaedae]SHL72732.1 Predicted PurR-regulated permease PerM [Roseibium suaedae]
MHHPKSLILARPAQIHPVKAHLGTAASISTIVIGIGALCVILIEAQAILAPVVLAVVIGLMFGPLADRIERFGISPWLSGAIVLAVFLTLISLAITGFAVPLSDWISKIPLIWNRVQVELANWQGVIKSVGALQDQIKSLAGSDAKMSVTLDDSTSVSDVALLAPAIASQLGIFLASLYFFISTRHNIRVTILTLCMSRKMRWRAAHIFRDVEHYVSHYLLQITGINLLMGATLALLLWLAGVPSALMWGLLACTLNYVIYIGPAVMVAVMLGVGLATAHTSLGIFIPPAIYLGLNVLESQVVTPHVLGRSMEINPFIIFLSLVFWIWIWGPIGGFIAVPSLLVLMTTFKNIRHMMF